MGYIESPFTPIVYGEKKGFKIKHNRLKLTIPCLFPLKTIDLYACISQFSILVPLSVGFRTYRQQKSLC